MCAFAIWFRFFSLGYFPLIKPRQAHAGKLGLISKRAILYLNATFRAERE
jgi:hypothetical protein